MLTGVCAWLAKGFVSAFWAFQGFNTYIQPILPRSARESTYAVETCLAMLGVHVVMFLVLFALGLKRSGR